MLTRLAEDGSSLVASQRQQTSQLKYSSSERNRRGDSQLSREDVGAAWWWHAPVLLFLAVAAQWSASASALCA